MIIYNLLISLLLGWFSLPALAEIRQVRHHLPQHFAASWDKKPPSKSKDPIPLQKPYPLNRLGIQLKPDFSDNPPAIKRTTPLQAKKNQWDWGTLPPADDYSEWLIAHNHLWLYAKQGDTWNLYHTPLNTPQSQWSGSSASISGDVIKFTLNKFHEPVVIYQNERQETLFQKEGDFTGGGHKILWNKTNVIPSTMVDELAPPNPNSERITIHGEFQLPQNVNLMALSWSWNGSKQLPLKYRVSQGPNDPYGAWRHTQSDGSIKLNQSGQFLEYRLSSGTNTLDMYPEIQLNYQVESGKAFITKAASKNGSGSSSGGGDTFIPEEFLGGFVSSDDFDTHSSSIPRLYAPLTSQNFRKSPSSNTDLSSGKQNPANAPDSSKPLANTNYDSSESPSDSSNQSPNKQNSSDSQNQDSSPNPQQLKSNNDSRTNPDISPNDEKRTPETSTIEPLSSEHSDDSPQSSPSKDSDPTESTNNSSPNPQSSTPESTSEEKNQTSLPKNNQSFSSQGNSSPNSPNRSNSKPSSTPPNSNPENNNQSPSPNENTNSDASNPNQTKHSPTSPNSSSPSPRNAPSNSPKESSSPQNQENIPPNKPNDAQPVTSSPHSSGNSGISPGSNDRPSRKSGKINSPSQGKTLSGFPFAITGTTTNTPITGTSGGGDNLFTSSGSSKDIESPTPTTFTYTAVPPTKANHPSKGKYYFTLLGFIFFAVLVWRKKKRGEEIQPEVAVSKNISWEDLIDHIDYDTTGNWEMACQFKSGLSAIHLSSGQTYVLNEHGELFQGTSKPIIMPEESQSLDSSLTPMTQLFAHNQEYFLTSSRGNVFLISRKPSKAYVSLLIEQKNGKRKIRLPKKINTIQTMNMAANRIWLLAQQENQPCVYQISCHKPEHWNPVNLSNCEKYNPLALSTGSDVVMAAIPEKDQEHIWFYHPSRTNRGDWLWQPLAKMEHVENTDLYLHADPRRLYMLETNTDNNGSRFQVFARDNRGLFTGKLVSSVSLPENFHPVSINIQCGRLVMQGWSHASSGAASGMILSARLMEWLRHVSTRAA